MMQLVDVKTNNAILTAIGRRKDQWCDINFCVIPERERKKKEKKKEKV